MFTSALRLESINKIAAFREVAGELTAPISSSLADSPDAIRAMKLV
jgi:hypothetical protein